MQLVDHLGGALPRGPVTVELDDIQATVLRYRVGAENGVTGPDQRLPGGRPSASPSRTSPA
jgi:hypothetical protein